MNIQRKIMLYAIIASLSIIVFNRIESVLDFVSIPVETYESVEELDVAYEVEQEVMSTVDIISMPRSWIQLDTEFFQVTSILGIGIIASIMLRLRE